MSNSLKRVAERGDANDRDAKRTKESKTITELLDLSQLTTPADIHARFHELAEYLLIRSRLHLKSGSQVTTYQLLEVEFYLNNHEAHCDPFCHSVPEQRYSGNWYFHKAPRRKSVDIDLHEPPTFTGYRGGTRKGLDLTFGPPLTSTHFNSSSTPPISGGMLIRSVRRVQDDAVISGPCLVVDELLRQSSAADIKILVVEHWLKRVKGLEPNNDGDGMWIEPVGSPNVGALPVVHSSPRIGLDLSHAATTPALDDPRVLFVARSYRFYLAPESLKVNGRIQTFAGLILLHDTSKPLSHTTIIREALAQGFSESATKKYIQAFEQGLANAKLNPYIGSAGKNLASSAVRYISMVATLRKLSVI